MPPHCEQPGHLFHLVMPWPSDRDAMIQHLKARGVSSVFHYLPLDSSPMARRWPGRAACPVAERVSACLLRLPFFTALEEEAQDVVIDAVTAYRVRQRSDQMSLTGSVPRD